MLEEKESEYVDLIIILTKEKLMQYQKIQSLESKIDNQIKDIVSLKIRLLNKEEHE